VEEEHGNPQAQQLIIGPQVEQIYIE